MQRGVELGSPSLDHDETHLRASGSSVASSITSRPLRTRALSASIESESSTRRRASAAHASRQRGWISCVSLVCALRTTNQRGMRAHLRSCTGSAGRPGRPRVMGRATRTRSRPPLDHHRPITSSRSRRARVTGRCHAVWDAVIDVNYSCPSTTTILALHAR